MSVNLTPVNIGSEPNKGDGDPIRTAFDHVNSNFTEISSKIEGLSNGVINNAGYIDTQVLVANTSTINALTVSNAAIFNSGITANSLYVNTSVTASTINSTGNITVGDSLNVTNDVVINGNLTVLGAASIINSTDLTVHDSVITLHYPSSGTLTSDDTYDIGVLFNYYKGGAKNAALIWNNNSGSLEYYAEGVQLSGKVTGVYGTIKAGSFFAANTSSNSIETNGGIVAAGTITSNSVVTGNIAAANVALSNTISLPTPLTDSLGSTFPNVLGSLWLTGTDNVYINGVPVTTSTSHFTGGMVPNLAWFVNGVTANSQVTSTSTTSGAMTVDGGLGVTGNIYAGAIRNTPISGSTGDFTSLSVASTFAASSVSFLGGYITNVHGDATQWSVTDFVSGNVKITGGTITGLTSLGASNVTLTSGNITGLTNLTTASATISAGSLTGLSQVTTTNLTSANGLVTNGTGARIAGDFTNVTVANRLMFQTTVTNGATNISAIPRGTIASTSLAGAFRIEDTSAITTGNGSSGGIELYQDTDLRLVSSTRGTGTYLPVTVYTNGSKSAQFSNNHDFTVFNTGGTAGVITLGSNGAAYASSFNGALAGNLTGTVLTGAQPNITSLGTLSTLSTSGDVTVGGSLNVDGPLASLNVTTLTVKDLNVTIANNAASAAAANGAGITVNGANATITYASATDSWDFNKNVSATLRTAAQPNITSVGTLGNLVVTGNISASNFNGNIYDNGSRVVTTATLGSYGVSQIVAGTNVTLTPLGGTGAVTINATSAPQVQTDWNAVSGLGVILNKPTLATVATTGSYNDLSSKPTIPAAQVQTDWNAVSGMSVLLNKPSIPAAQVQSDWNSATGVSAILNKPTIPAAQVQPDWNAVSGMGAILNKPTLPSGQVQTDWNAVSGMGVLLNKPTSLPGAKYTESGTAPSGPTAGDQWYNTASDILYQYIGTSWVDVFTAGVTATSTATVNAIVQRDSSAGASFNALNATTLTVSATVGVAATGNGTQDIGTSANKFRSFYGVSTSAQYADLAEIYMADKNYLPGTVVVFGGRDEITANDHEYDTRIAGVVSTNPAYLMNDTATGLQENGSYAIPVALTGRVPCRVLGPIKKGDLLVASKFAGVAKAIDNAQWLPGCVIGKALSDLPNVEITIIEVVIGRF
jgi:hypothetical protein